MKDHRVRAVRVIFHTRASQARTPVRLQGPSLSVDGVHISEWSSARVCYAGAIFSTSGPGSAKMRQPVPNIVAFALAAESTRSICQRSKLSDQHGVHLLFESLCSAMRDFEMAWAIASG